MTTLAERRPTLFSVASVIVPVIGIKLLGAALRALSIPELPRLLIVEATFALYVALLLTRLGWWREAGFTTAFRGLRLLACLPLLYLPLVVLASNGIKSASPTRAVGFTLFTLLVGFAEEGLLRGIVLRALLPKGVVRAAVLSSVIFGVSHLANLRGGGYLGTIIVQVIYATLLGIGMAGVRIYTGSIGPAIALHMLVDLSDMASRGFAMAPPHPLASPHDAIGPIGLTAIWGLYGWWLLRRASAATTLASGAEAPAG